MKRYLWLAAAAALASACADAAPAPLDPTASGVARSAMQPSAVPTRAEQRPGTLAEASIEALWRHIEAAGGRAAVGLKAPGAARGVYRGEVLLAAAARPQAQSAVLAQRGVTLLSEDALLPVIEVSLADADALRAVRRLGVVDYVEPVLVQGDLTRPADVGGCGWGSGWGSDRVYTPSGDLYSVKFEAQNIPAAWERSSGAGVAVGLVDTGVSADQGQLLWQFADGASAGRTHRLFYISSLGSPYDECGHGTRMAGALAAPMDGSGVVGVAWGADLNSVRHANGVAAVSSSDAKYAIRGAVENGSDIVAMAWQSLNWFWQVSDEIEYWHYRRPVLFLGAAGTSECDGLIFDDNVVFPADMSEVVAVTGVSYPDGSVPCGIHYGPEVELTAYLDVPSTGRTTPDLAGIGGSSNATAVVSGIAALAWSANPGLSRDELRGVLQRAGAGYPQRDSRLGYGLVDALKAVGGEGSSGGGGGGKPDKPCRGKKCN
jgi:serine protease